MEEEAKAAGMLEENGSGVNGQEEDDDSEVEEMKRLPDSGVKVVRRS